MIKLKKVIKFATPKTIQELQETRELNKIDTESKRKNQESEGFFTKLPLETLLPSDDSISPIQQELF